MTIQHRGVRAQIKPRAALAAVAGVAGLMMGGLAHGAESDEILLAQAKTATGETVEVTGARKKMESPKYTAPLLDTPQTITVIDAGTIRGQNLLTLREILSTAPGITFGAGEGGGGYGDSINLRGYAANADITVDGVKDSAQYTRTDPFNLEQIELVNGANSVYGGSGSLGGSINLVTKTPHGANTTTVVGGIGTDSYGRATIDADYEISEGIAFRLNAMGHTNDVPGRDVEEYSRWAIAPSLAIGLGSKTTLTLSYLHQEDDNIPQYGVPYYKNAFFNGPLPGVSNAAYYGYANLDTQEIGVDQFTAKIDHEFSDWLSIRNLTRYQEVTQVSVVDPPQSGVWCIGGVNAQTGAACATSGFYTPGGPRGNRRDTKNTLLYNQTDFAAHFATGGLQHSLVFGFSFASEDYHLETGNVLRNLNGATPNPALPNMSIANPNTIWSGPVNFVRTGVSDGEQTSKAVYLFDTIELNEQWEINAGLRYDRVEGEFTAAALPANTTPGSGVGPWTSNQPALVQGAIFRNEDELLSYRFGLVYKPVANASIYVAYGNTETPSQASVNGGCTIATCNVDPEKGEIYELGVKWNVFNDRLSLSASLFQNDRTNYKVPAVDPTLPADQVLDGEARVRGLTLSATGNITDELTIFANYTYLDTEVIQGVSDYCLTQPLTNTACYTATTPLPGNPLLATPEHSGSFWLTYAFGNGFSLGYGASYQGEFYPQNTVTNAGGVRVARLLAVDDYWLHSAMINYEVRDGLSLQLNVKNLFDEDYFIRVRNNGWAVPGDARSATLTATYTF